MGSRVAVKNFREGGKRGKKAIKGKRHDITPVLGRGSLTINNREQKRGGNPEEYKKKSSTAWKEGPRWKKKG